MDPKRLLIAHVEKLVLVLVVALCAWSVWSTIENPDTITSATDQALKDVQQHLSDAQGPGVGKPNFAPVRRYDRDLPARLALEIDAQPVASWLIEHPDIGGVPEKNQDVKPYIYEMPRPAIDPDRSKPGNQKYDVVVGIPAVQRENRMTREGIALDLLMDVQVPTGAHWQRDITEGDVMRSVHNTARSVGLQVQMVQALEKPAADSPAWQDLEVEGVRSGFLRCDISQGVASFTVVGIEPGKTYWVRTRVLAVASGYSTLTEPPTARYGQEVLVVSPPLDQPVSNEEEAQKIHQLIANEGPVAGEAQRLERILNGVTTKETEKLYGGVWSEPYAFTGPLLTFVALERVNDFQPPAVANLLVMKWQDMGGGKFLWTEPAEFAVQVDETVGKDQHGVDVGGKRLPLDMRTPYKLVQMQGQGPQRVRWYEVSRKILMKDGQPVVDPETRIPLRNLQVVESTGPTQTVVLENTITKQRETLVKLERRLFQRPKNETWFYPDFGGQQVEEIELWKQNPAAFQAPRLRPPAPKVHRNAALLEQMVRLGLILPQKVNAIELPYVEMPDGRVIFYDTFEETVQVVLLPGAAVREAAPPPAEPAAEPEAAPAAP